MRRTWIMTMSSGAVGMAFLVAPAVPAAAAETPFKADFSVQASFVPLSPGVLAGSTSGAGKAAHLGRMTVSSTEVLDFTAVPGAVTVRDGRMVLVAASGDEVFGTYATIGPLPDANGYLPLSGTFVVTGGTGRFSDATGGGTIEGVASVVTGIASLSYRGTITR